MLSADVAVGLGQVALCKYSAANGAFKLVAGAVEEAGEDLVLEHFLWCIRIQGDYCT